MSNNIVGGRAAATVESLKDRLRKGVVSKEVIVASESAILESLEECDDRLLKTGMMIFLERIRIVRRDVGF